MGALFPGPEGQEGGGVWVLSCSPQGQGDTAAGSKTNPICLGEVFESPPPPPQGP